MNELAGVTARSLGSHTRSMWSAAAQRLGVPFEELLEAIGSTPGGSPLTVEDVAGIATFVASQRSAGLTGTVLNVTRGAAAD